MATLSNPLPPMHSNSNTNAQFASARVLNDEEDLLGMNRSVNMQDQTSTPTGAMVPHATALPSYGNYSFAQPPTAGPEYDFASPTSAASYTYRDPYSTAASDTSTSLTASNANTTLTSTLDQPTSQSMVVAPGRTLALPGRPRAMSAPVQESAGVKKARRRRRRRLRMAAGTAGGLVVGGLVLGPVGAVVGGVGAAAATRAASKKGEKRKDDRVEKQGVTRSAQSSSAPVHTGVHA